MGEFKHEKSFLNNTNLDQGLADLGYPRGMWEGLSPEEKADIVERQLSYLNYSVKNTTKENKQIPEEFKQKYKQAYEKLQAHLEMVDVVNNPEQKELMRQVLTLSGQSTNVVDIDSFILKNKEQLSSEEIEFLNMRKEWLGF